MPFFITFSHIVYLLSIVSFAKICYPQLTHTRVGYGEFCDDSSIYCNLYQFLICRNNSCICEQNRSMIYEPTTNSCSLKVGEKCFSHDKYQPKCEKNAYCHDYGKSPFPLCQCLSKFYNVNGTCIPRKVFQSECNEDVECLSGLKCIDGFCTCEGLGQNSSYNIIFKKCEALEGKLCSIISDYDESNNCVQNAYCDKAIKKCKCLYYICLPSYNQQCNSILKCTQGLKCVDQICQCEYSDHQEWNAKKGICITLVNGPCNSNTTCVTKSKCTLEENNTCKCDKGYKETVGRKCNIGYGETCPEDDFGCNKEANLYCIDRKCSCMDDLRFYDEEEKKCKGNIGAGCLDLPEYWCSSEKSCRSAKEFI